MQVVTVDRLSSLTVIIIEATGNVTYGLPIIIAVIFAKWVSVCDNGPCTDTYAIGRRFIQRGALRYSHRDQARSLAWLGATGEMYVIFDYTSLTLIVTAKWQVRAGDFMQRRLDCLRLTDKVRGYFELSLTMPKVEDVYNMLRISKHNAFAVVDWYAL